MTGVPFMGGEAGAFTPFDSHCYESVNYYDAAFARCSMVVDTSLSNWTSASIQSLTDAWCAFFVRVPAGFSGDFALFQWLDGTETVRIQMNWNPSTFALKLFYYNSGWFQVGSTVSLDMTSATQRIHVHATVNTASGVLDLYVGNTRAISSGTVDLSSITSINKVRFLGINLSYLTRPVYYSEVIVDTDPTIGRRVGTIVMTGQGSTHTYASGGFAAIDEIVYDDTDSINGDTNGQIELFTGTPVFSGTGYRIKGLCLTARSRKSGSGPAQKRFKLKAGATTANGTTLAQDFGYLSYFHSWTTNPDTTNAFLMSELTSLNYGEEAIT